MKAHSEATKAKIRTSCLRREFPQDVKDKIARRNLEVNAKKVRCIETSEIFESISAAARFYKVAPITISRVCHKIRHTCKGKVFEFII